MMVIMSVRIHCNARFNKKIQICFLGDEIDYTSDEVSEEEEDVKGKEILFNIIFN